jgi:hypothetical protein
LPFGGLPAAQLVDFSSHEIILIASGARRPRRAAGAIQSVKIYFYRSDKFVRAVHADYRRHRLRPYLRYLAALERYLRRFATADAHEADYFFVPINLISFQFWGKKKRFQDPYPYIASLQYLGRKPHLLFAAGDFGQRRRSAYETEVPWRPYPEVYPWLDERFVLLAFESTADLAPQDIALFPYVLEPESLIDRLRWAMARRWIGQRDLLYSFAGVTQYAELPPQHIRGGRLKSIEGVTLDSFVGTLEDARNRYGPLRGSDAGMLRRSVFTLCPAGFGRWSFRFVQAAMFGSIPVLLSDGYVKPMARYIDWDRCCLTLPESDVAKVPALLRAMPRDEISRYQNKLRNTAAKLTARAMHDMLAKELSGRLVST